MRQPKVNRDNIYDNINSVKSKGILCENCCDNCILFEHPEDGHMSCKIILRSFEQEFERSVNSMKNGCNQPVSEGYGYFDAGHYSWMDLFALTNNQRSFTALAGCGLFVKKDSAYVFDI